ncbi:MAG: hypothetical protein ACI93N_001677 [Flavobacteriaceae bacterium]|jgi:hypothetical protein
MIRFLKVITTSLFLMITFPIWMLLYLTWGIAFLFFDYFKTSLNLKLESNVENLLVALVAGLIYSICTTGFLTYHIVKYHEFPVFYSCLILTFFLSATIFRSKILLVSGFEEQIKASSYVVIIVSMLQMIIGIFLSFRIIDDLSGMKRIGIGITLLILGFIGFNYLFIEPELEEAREKKEEKPNH